MSRVFWSNKIFTKLIDLSGELSLLDRKSIYCPRIDLLSKQNHSNKRKKNVNAHNYGQWIGVEKDLSVIEPHTIYIITIFEQF